MFLNQDMAFERDENMVRFCQVKIDDAAQTVDLPASKEKAPEKIQRSHSEARAVEVMLSSHVAETLLQASK